MTHAVAVSDVSLVPPHPARLLVHVHMGLRVARLGADHRARRTLQWRVLVAAEWHGHFRAGSAGRRTRTPCLSPVRHDCLSGQARTSCPSNSQGQPLQRGRLTGFPSAASVCRATTAPPYDVLHMPGRRRQVTWGPSGGKGGVMTAVVTASEQDLRTLAGIVSEDRPDLPDGEGLPPSLLADLMGQIRCDGISLECFDSGRQESRFLQGIPGLGEDGLEAYEDLN